MSNPTLGGRPGALATDGLLFLVKKKKMTTAARQIAAMIAITIPAIPPGLRPERKRERNTLNVFHHSFLVSVTVYKVGYFLLISIFCMYKENKLNGGTITKNEIYSACYLKFSLMHKLMIFGMCFTLYISLIHLLIPE